MADATKCSFGVLPDPLFSPDLATLDFYLFPHLKTELRGENIGINEGVIDSVDGYLGDQEEGFFFEEICKLEELCR